MLRAMRHRIGSTGDKRIAINRDCLIGIELLGAQLICSL
jgi:hypothetical protein